MRPIDVFLNADTIKFSALAYDWASDAPFYHSSGTNQLKGICVSKLPGSLSFKVGASDLRFSGYPVEIIFDGKDAGTDVSGRSLIEWTVNQKPDIYLSQVDFTPDAIDGKFAAAVPQLNPPQAGSGCDGFSRSFTTHLQAFGNLNFTGHRHFTE